MTTEGNSESTQTKTAITTGRETSVTTQTIKDDSTQPSKATEGLTTLSMETIESTESTHTNTTITTSETKTTITTSEIFSATNVNSNLPQTESSSTAQWELLLVTTVKNTDSNQTTTSTPKKLSATNTDTTTINKSLEIETSNITRNEVSVTTGDYSISTQPLTSTESEELSMTTDKSMTSIQSEPLFTTETKIKITTSEESSATTEKNTDFTHSETTRTDKQELIVTTVEKTDSTQPREIGTPSKEFSMITDKNTHSAQTKTIGTTRNELSVTKIDSMDSTQTKTTSGMEDEFSLTTDENVISVQPKTMTTTHTKLLMTMKENTDSTQRIQSSTFGEALSMTTTEMTNSFQPKSTSTADSIKQKTLSTSNEEFLLTTYKNMDTSQQKTTSKSNELLPITTGENSEPTQSSEIQELMMTKQKSTALSTSLNTKSDKISTFRSSSNIYTTDPSSLTVPETNPNTFYSSSPSVSTKTEVFDSFVTSVFELGTTELEAATPLNSYTTLTGTSRNVNQDSTNVFPQTASSLKSSTDSLEKELSPSLSSQASSSSVPLDETTGLKTFSLDTTSVMKVLLTMDTQTTDIESYTDSLNQPTKADLETAETARTSSESQDENMIYIPTLQATTPTSVSPAKLHTTEINSVQDDKTEENSRINETNVLENTKGEIGVVSTKLTTENIPIVSAENEIVSTDKIKTSTDEKTSSNGSALIIHYNSVGVSVTPITSEIQVTATTINEYELRSLSGSTDKTSARPSASALMEESSTNKAVSVSSHSEHPTSLEEATSSSSITDSNSPPRKNDSFSSSLVGKINENHSTTVTELDSTAYFKTVENVTTEINLRTREQLQEKRCQQR